MFDTFGVIIPEYAVNVITRYISNDSVSKNSFPRGKGKGITAYTFHFTTEYK